MTPGAQILVARKGKVVYQKSFGYHTYDKKQEVKNTDLYDVPSLTKILSTLPNLMIQFDKQKVKLDTKLSTILLIFKGTNKEDPTLVDMLTHQARFKPTTSTSLSLQQTKTRKLGLEYALLTRNLPEGARGDCAWGPRHTRGCASTPSIAKRWACPPFPGCTRQAGQSPPSP